ncbi:MAG: hypothetical protein EZS28_000226 [Streblomastix strix]|uniref:Uncharacterized protein n=1 Tax=Streblomastix strix TaxID=222440 RepID=A0A5J4XCJ2_9EUKA|nr:MAG: hypothetical protein EZS28_000226 [Streblomastix strix]
MARIRLVTRIDAHSFDGNNNSVMGRTNLATTQRQISIQQLTSGQRFASEEGILIGANAFLNLQPPQRRAMFSPQSDNNKPHQFSLQFKILSNKGADSEGNQTQKHNIIARNSHTVMEIDMESEGRDINPPPLKVKINQASFSRQRYYLTTKSYLLKYIGKPGAGYHHLSYQEGQTEVEIIILRHARGETISIAD